MKGSPMVDNYLALATLEIQLVNIESNDSH